MAELADAYGSGPYGLLVRRGSTPLICTTSLKLRGANAPYKIKRSGRTKPWRSRTHMYYVYILKLSNNDYYIGRTDNLKKRLKDHLNGTERTTKKYLPCKLICYISFESRNKSFKFEKYLKTGSGLAFRKRHLV